MMLGKGQCIILLFLFSNLNVLSQDSTLFINLEAGMDGIGSNFVEKDYFREIRQRTNGLFGPRIVTQINKSFAGIKIEKRTVNTRFGFSAGLRFTRLESSVIKSGVPNFFYILLRQTGTTTEYLQVRQLTEVADYLGIPLEVSFHVPGSRTFRFYVMAGLEWSYRLRRKTDVLFSSPGMESYESDVARIIGEPDPYYAAMYARAGLIIGKRKPIFSYGVTLPVVITNTVSAVNKPVAGAGFQIQFYLPLRNTRI
jgi:hypothetical protein